MGELKNFRLNDKEVKTFEHIKNTLDLKTDASVFRFFMKCGYEAVFGNEEEKETILKEISKLKDQQNAIAESLIKIENRSKKDTSEIACELNKNYKGILETLRQTIKPNAGFRQDPEKIFDEIKSRIEE